MNYEKDELIKALGIESMDAELQDKVLETLYSTMNTRLAMRTADELSDEQLEEFNKLVESGPDQVMEWLAKTVPNYEAIIDEELQTVLAEIKQAAKPFQQ